MKINKANNDLSTKRKELAEDQNKLNICNQLLDLNSSPNALVKNNLLKKYNEISQNIIKNISDREIEIDFKITVDGSTSNKRFLNEGSGEKSSEMQDEDDYVDVEYKIKTQAGAFKNKDINSFMSSNATNFKDINKIIELTNSLQEGLKFIQLTLEAFELKEQEIYKNEKVNYVELNLNEEQLVLLDDFEKIVKEKFNNQTERKIELEEQIKIANECIKRYEEELSNLIKTNEQPVDINIVANAIGNDPEKQQKIAKIKNSLLQARILLSSIISIAALFTIKTIFNIIESYKNNSNYANNIIELTKAALNIMIENKYTFIPAVITITIMSYLLYSKEVSAKKEAFELIG